jgi:hypothetical protein
MDPYLDSEKLVNQRGGDARSQQHARNNHIQDVLNALHTISPRIQALLNHSIPLCANGFVHSKFFLYVTHLVLALWVAQRLSEPLLAHEFC